VKSVLLSHPGCAPFVQHTARALYEVGLLSAYVTTFCYQPGSWLGRALRTTLRLVMRDPERQLVRRQITEVPREMVISYPMPELLRMAAAKLPLESIGPIVADLVWEQTELWFDRIVARKHTDGVAAVYGYEHACLETFRAAKARGALCIYEMPICHHKTVEELLRPEFERIPEVETPYEEHRRRLAPRRNARKDEELRLADLVIVNSSFTRESLIRAGVPDVRISVVPLGSPAVATDQIERPKNSFIFLYAGSLSVRKGVHYLLEAWRRLSPGRGVELWLIGTMHLPKRLFDTLPGTVVVRPSVSRDQLFEIYRRVSVLVFPSLCEGFGMVITEAMAHGLPVITTPNTAGRDLIRHGQNGFIVPIRDVDCLAETMQWCLDHQDDLSEVGRQAALTAASWQWSDYRASLGRVVHEFLHKHPGG